MSLNNINNLEILIEKWAEDRGIIANGTVAGQMEKLSEEFGELIAGLLRNDKPETLDAIGDMVVVLTIIAKLSGSSLTECLNLAYSQIKDRTGYLNPQGVFVKDK